MKKGTLPKYTISGYIDINPDSIKNLVTFEKKLNRMYSYEHEIEKCGGPPIINVEVYFKLDAHNETMRIPLIGLIDTGACVTHISQTKVPKELLELYKDKKVLCHGAGKNFESIAIPRAVINFPIIKEGEITYIELVNIYAIDDGKQREERKTNGSPIYDILIGADVLSNGTFSYDGKSKKYTLTMFD